MTPESALKITLLELSRAGQFRRGWSTSLSERSEDTELSSLLFSSSKHSSGLASLVLIFPNGLSEAQSLEPCASLALSLRSDPMISTRRAAASDPSRGR